MPISSFQNHTSFPQTEAGLGSSKMHLTGKKIGCFLVSYSGKMVDTDFEWQEGKDNKGPGLA